MKTNYHEIVVEWHSVVENAKLILSKWTSHLGLAESQGDAGRSFWSLSGSYGEEANWESETRRERLRPRPLPLSPAAILVYTSAAARERRSFWIPPWINRFPLPDDHFLYIWCDTVRNFLNDGHGLSNYFSDLMMQAAAEYIRSFSEAKPY